jgi:bis(5'-nucleosyl)-tetraphosphatase (symmetrical)
VVANYAIGDVQGCFDELQALLAIIDFDRTSDTLWFVGDLVNRGPKSLEVLRFVKSLEKSIVILGNHDLHLLALAYKAQNIKPHKDNLQSILDAEDCEQLCDWLRKQKILHFDEQLNVVITHAGIAPFWDLEQAINYARELEAVLHSDNYLEFFNDMYGNQPEHWSEDLSGWERLRIITNCFTRMRFCNPDGSLNLTYKGTLEDAPSDLIPWFKLAKRKPISCDQIFGHWAALQGRADTPGLYAIDTGCLWGNQLTALRLEDRKKFSVSCAKKESLSDE